MAPQNTQTIPPRDPVLDMVRGIGIVLMVVGHSGCTADGFIYLFHMALFFMLSGVLFNPKNSADAAGLGRFLFAKVKTLWLPFVVANTCFTVLNNLFLRLNILTDDPRITALAGNFTHAPTTLRDVIGRTVHWCVFDGGTQLGGALWFVQVLFQLSVLYAVLDFALKKLLPQVNILLLQGVVAALLLGLGFAAQRAGWGVWSLDIAASCYSLFYLGQLLRRLAPRLPQTPPAQLAAAIAGFAALLWLGRYGSVGLAANLYLNPAFLLAASLAGWALVKNTAALLARLAPARDVLCRLGRATMPVVVLHFLAFKAVTALGLAATGGERYLLAAFPVYFTGGAWWLAYTAAGLGLPLAAAAGWQAAKTALLRKREGAHHG